MQKQPPEKSVKKLFFKILNILRKTPVLETLFNSEYCLLNIQNIFQRTYFEEHLRMIASEIVHEIEKS